MVKHKKPVTILGIDPGTTRLGYGVVSGNRLSPALLASGVIGNAALAKDKRLIETYRKLTGVIAAAKPDAVAVEKLFFSKNVKTAMAVAEARGIILLTAALANLRVYEYTPQEIKIALTGNGAASKMQVAAMARALLKTDVSPRWDDETDAIAVALTALVSVSIGNH